jgi:hypothetical protein
MREHFLTGLDVIIGTAGYFLLDDLVRPPLQERHMLVLWWLILALYLAILFAYGSRPVWRARPGLVAMGCLLLAAAVYSSDSTIQPHLASIGLGWLWMPLIGGFFVWLIVFATYIRNRARHKPN